MAMLLNLLNQLFSHAASRKVAMTVTAMGLIALMGVLAGLIPAMAGSLVTVVGGITGCLALYVGANVADGRLQLTPTKEPTAAKNVTPAKDVKKLTTKDDEEGS